MLVLCGNNKMLRLVSDVFISHACGRTPEARNTFCYTEMQHQMQGGMWWNMKICVANGLLFLTCTDVAAGLGLAIIAPVAGTSVCASTCLAMLALLACALHCDAPP